MWSAFCSLNNEACAVLQVDSSSELDEIHEEATPRKKMKLMYSRSRNKSPCKGERGSADFRNSFFIFSDFTWWLSFVIIPAPANDHVKVECVLNDPSDEVKVKEMAKKSPSQNQ